MGKDIILVAYADDLAIVVSAKTTLMMEELANYAVTRQRTH